MVNVNVAQSVGSSSNVNAVKIADKDSTKEQPKRSYFQASLGYLSNAVYNGRHDSLTTPYISPSFGYYNQSGFYIVGSMSYLLSATESRIDLFGLSTGYDFTIIKDKLTGGLSADKSFYNKASTAVKSAEKGSVGANLSYDFDVVELSVGSDVSFGAKTDISSNASLAHEFKIEGEKGSSWAFTPAASILYSTLNFYEEYTNRKVGKNTKKKNVTNKSVTSITTIDNHKGFTLLDYEFKVPVAYEAKNWGVSFTPELAVPKNSMITTTTTTTTFKNKPTLVQTIDSTPASEKNLKPIFYFEVEAHWKLFTGLAKAK
jgi:hypothetical protein